MSRFFDKAISFGPKHIAAEILYEMCDIKEKKIGSLSIKNFRIYRDNLASVLADKMGLDQKTYGQLSREARKEVRKNLAIDLAISSREYESLYDYYRVSDKRLFLSRDKGIVYNQVQTDKDLINVSFCLPEDLFGNKKELQNHVGSLLMRVNKMMLARLAEEKVEHAKTARCCARSE